MKIAPALGSSVELMSDLSFQETLGHVCQILYSCTREEYPLAALKYWTAPAIELNQIALFKSLQGMPIGYMTWAFLSDEVSTRMEMDAINVLHISEWNEGLNLWILDFVAPFGHAKDISRYVRGEMFSRAAVVKALKRREDDSLIRVRTFRRRHAKPA